MSPYLQGIRALVGHGLLVLPTVAVLPLDPSRERLLLVQEAAPVGAGRWMTIGGMVEPGESPEEAARREAAEEAGVDVELVRLVGAFGGPGYEATYPNGDRAACVPIVYEARLGPGSGSPVPDGEETAAARWVPLGKVLALDLTPVNRRLLGEVLPLLA